MFKEVELSEFSNDDDYIEAFLSMDEYCMIRKVISKIEPVVTKIQLEKLRVIWGL